MEGLQFFVKPAKTTFSKSYDASRSRRARLGTPDKPSFGTSKAETTKPALSWSNSADAEAICKLGKSAMPVAKKIDAG
jgi:hypothetical protein